MPESTMFEPPDSAYREHLDSNIFHGEEEVTLKALTKKVKKPKWEVFQNLLWLSQQGEVHLEQANPEAFGEITIFRERKE
jgi:chromatin segregation and condensation protein Rec8/ScpA/Scc1 (kleisin family)